MSSGALRRPTSPSFERQVLGFLIVAAGKRRGTVIVVALAAA